MEIDSRPRDAIALAVRAQVPIYAEEQVLEKAGVLLDKETGKPIAQEEATSEEGERAPVSEEEQRRMSAFTDFINTLDLDDLGNPQQGYPRISKVLPAPASRRTGAVCWVRPAEPQGWTHVARL